MLPERIDWKSFIDVTTGGAARPHLMKAATLLRQERGDGELLDALDLGCGAGRDSDYLLRNGYRVTAVDSSPAAAGPLRRLPRQRWLRFVECPIESFTPETYDLVNAQYVLPFVERSQFAHVVGAMVNAVRMGGVLACNFFGTDDEWNRPGSALTFLSREEAEASIGALTLISMDEENVDGRTADGEPKHWHLFHVIARRPASTATSARQ